MRRTKQIGLFLAVVDNHHITPPSPPRCRCVALDAAAAYKLVILPSGGCVTEMARPLPACLSRLLASHGGVSVGVTDRLSLSTCLDEVSDC